MALTRNSASRIAITCLALVGAIYLAARGVVLCLAYYQSFGPPAGTDIRSVASPDGKFKVVEFSLSGGGGLSPFCDVIFAVVPTRTTDDQAWSREFRVAQIPCLGVQRGGIIWQSTDELKIVLDLNNSVRGGLLDLKPRDATGRVLIEYGTQ